MCDGVHIKRPSSLSHHHTHARYGKSWQIYGEFLKEEYKDNIYCIRIHIIQYRLRLPFSSEIIQIYVSFCLCLCVTIHITPHHITILERRDHCDWGCGVRRRKTQIFLSGGNMPAQHYRRWIPEWKIEYFGGDTKWYLHLTFSVAD